ncbi:aminotransferase class V-fold PLP-dependent enzyme [Aphanothece sacrum]|uniref:Cysteine desulfurase n=1 Tax=Aphanothece sacrum FPU1 TaxID=1920663 RepID=A0A401IFG5_APHSA|nr:aminotransferase class V-fold PLP-dependent enzyme [Aphanothece sacrum]GBF79949.1 cysteine desulfurase [Aphanothece sacrum FPU1]GBF83831.1 cysteine desulfurase [Aphanothece sacrum FPU3]
MNNSLWLLNSNITFLNHGSYGATPIPVLNYQTYLREKLEQEPVDFMAQQLEPLLDEAREKLANFINIDSPNIAFIPNATFGVNTVLRSLYFKPGDEILITNHIYNACLNTVELVAKQTGAKVIIASIPFPLTSLEQIINPILDKVSSRTKITLIDHITSQTALIFPLEYLVKELSQRGVETLIDGAHAPGFLPLNLRKIGATYYTGNCHKWLCAPKGAAFLYVRPDKQSQIRPLIISHGANSTRSDRSRFLLEFDWMGTNDYTPYLCIPKAIEVMGNLFNNGWLGLWENNHLLARQGRDIICERLNICLPCPDEMIGSMASIPLPKLSVSGDKLYHDLREEFKIQIPIIPWGNEQYLVRISAQFYNNLEQYEYLIDVLSRYC